MPIDFPNSPTIGQQFSAGGQTWVWNGAVWSAYRGGPVVQTGATAPSTVAEGLIWFNTTNGRTYVYYDGAWVDLATASAISTAIIANSSGDAFSVTQQGAGRALAVSGPVAVTGTVNATTLQQAGSAVSLASDLSSHNSATTSVHGISDTANLVYTGDARLTDSRTPTAHAASHGSGGSDAITIAASQVSGTAVVTTDARLSDARTPTSHAASHGVAGSDPLTLTQSQVTNLTTDLAAKVSTSAVGAANGVASLDANSKIPSSQLPAIAITDTFVAANQSAMLALSAQVGDVAVRSDVSKTFILTAEPATTLSNWQELLTPPDAVTSVDGRAGVVTLSDLYAAKAHASSHAAAGSDPLTLAQSQVTNLTTDLSAKAPSASPTFTGAVTLSGTVTGDVLPTTDNTGVVGSAASTWSNGQFTNLTVDDTLSVRGAVDLDDSDVFRLGSSDDVQIFYNGTTNQLNIELETAATGILITDNGTPVASISKAGAIDATAYTQAGQPLQTGGGGGDITPFLLIGV